VNGVLGGCPRFAANAVDEKRLGKIPQTYGR